MYLWGVLAPSSQNVGSLLRNPLVPGGKACWKNDQCIAPVLIF